MKGFGRIRWEIARRRAVTIRRRFDSLIRSPGWAPPPPVAGDTGGLYLVSFSGKAGLPEQIASILSFLRYCGRPARWVIYSDGTHDEDSQALLEPWREWLRLESWDANLDGALRSAPVLEQYAAEQAMGKRMIAYSRHTLDGPTLFLDNDILFFPRIAELLPLAIRGDRPWFLPDVAWGAFDSVYLASHPAREMYGVNGGFFLLKPGFSWQIAIDYIGSLDGSYEFFSDQTAYHLCLTAQGACPLDPRRFIVSLEDQFSYRSAFRTDRVAMRHYVHDVRHHFWLNAADSGLTG